MADTLKILILEDSPTDVELIRRELKNLQMSLSFAVASNREEFLTALQSLNPDLVLSDHSLPQFDSLEALELVRNFNPSVPFLLVTGAVSEEFAVTVLHRGADDYILKNNLVRLPSAIINAIKKRTAIREREQMLQMLIQTNEELNMFLHKATHDLRGPLTSIMGLARYAQKESVLNPKQEQNFRMISESADKLDLVLLDLIQAVAIKNSTLQIEEFDPAELIDLVIKELGSVPDASRIRYDMDIQFGGDFRSDKKMLRSVLFQVIKNGIIYQDISTLDPYIRIGISEGKSREICVEIEDNGIGIDDPIRDKIFALFYRGNMLSKGTGIGLYLARHCVLRLGGSISIKNETRKGTTVVFTIPRSIDLGFK